MQYTTFSKMTTFNSTVLLSVCTCVCVSEKKGAVMGLHFDFCQQEHTFLVSRFENVIKAE